MLNSDRTADFFNFVERHDSTRSEGRIGSSGQSNRYSNSIQGSQFNLLASEISQEMNSTSLKIEELNRIVKQKGLFRDRTNQIHQLTEDIKTSVTELNSRLEVLQQHAQQGFPSSGGYYQSSQHYMTMVETLKARMLDITRDFKDTLQKRTEVIQQQDWRRNLYSYSSNSNHLSGITGSSMGDSKASFNTGTKYSKMSKVSFDIESGEHGMEQGGSGFEFGAAQSMMQHQNQSFSYARSRAEAVENVQRMIGELAQIFQKVAGMVTQQEEMIQRIDEDITNTFSNVEHGHAELIKYYNYVKSNRGLIIKLFLLLIAFIIFFVVFLT
ncbi:syntaxin 5A transmembrane domain or GPI at C-terminus [Cryptosporidium sp. chipmunk genotype I]|uniref:syntaxin 5A transmembrane domain or GPI at C-terminus n=1 Tax=Cryptosporidium sp. chipmunk genotype I TaxID=1280935 RepID=UPI003519F373|nr:syntaxin 5A transmembrane domain or GPI at C-terminus [Cryptosporidium sp. chipmunk genotype I]